MKYLCISMLLLSLMCCKSSKDSIFSNNYPNNSSFLKMKEIVREQIDPYLYQKFISMKQESKFIDSKDQFRLAIIKDIGSKSDTIIFDETDNLFDYYCCVYTSCNRITTHYHYPSNVQISKKPEKAQIEKTDRINAVLNGSINNYINKIKNTTTTPPLTIIITVFYRTQNNKYNYYQKQITTQ